MRWLLESIGFEWNIIDTFWHKMFERLKQHYLQHRNIKIPRTADRQLAQWISTQRVLQRKGKLSEDRAALLEAVGIQWNTNTGGQLFEPSWQDMYQLLKSYKQAHGNCLVPYSYKESDLGKWVIGQRMLFKRRRLSTSRQELLEHLGFVWDKREADWKQTYEALKEFKVKHGNCRVPRNYALNKRLASWVGNQRQYFFQGQLSQEKIKKLDALTFEWNPGEEDWGTMYHRLVAYKAAHGNCAVSKYHPDKQLGHWVRSQRRAYLKKIISKEHHKKLEALGFQWSALEADWQENFNALEALKQKTGNCRLTNDTDRKLVTWVGTQRQFYRAGKMSNDRIAKLEAIGFEWNPMGDDWQKRFAELEEFKKKHGHCQAPKKIRLHSWSKLQRNLYFKKRLPADRIAKLESIGFEWVISTPNNKQLTMSYQTIMPVGEYVEKIKSQLFKGQKPLTVKFLAADAKCSEDAVCEVVNLLKNRHQIEHGKDQEGQPTVRLVPNTTKALKDGKLFVRH